MVQQKTPWMDGVGSVSQCPINPGETFVYRFLAYPVGTHWYHSHSGTTRSDGLFGPLIVIPKEENKQSLDDGYTKEFIMMIHDWTREDSRDVTNQIYWGLGRTLFSITFERMNIGSSNFAVWTTVVLGLSFSPGYDDMNNCYYSTRQHDGTEVGPSPFVSLLVNGKGFHFSGGTNIPDKTNPSMQAEHPNIPLEWFNVEQDSIYRFRVIGTSILYAIKLSIDQHDMLIISVDGNAVNERRVTHLIVHSGERYDFVLDAKENIANYWIRLETLEKSDITQPANTTNIPSGKGFAVLHYDTANNELPSTAGDVCTAAKKCIILNCPYSIHIDEARYGCIFLSNLTSRRELLQRFPVPTIESKSNLQEEFLNFHFSGVVSKRSSVNGHKLVFPSAPPQTYPSYNPFVKCDDSCRIHCRCTFVLEIPLGKVVQMTFLNMGVGAGSTGTAHPVHLHGHHFHVLKMGLPDYDVNGLYLRDNSDILCDEPDGKRLCNNPRWADATWWGDSIPGLNRFPPMKDTIIVPVGGYIVLRYKADNPGYWFVHCHIEIHQVEGMGLIIKEGTEGEMSPLPSGFPKCGDFRWTANDFEKAINLATRSELTWLTAIAASVLHSTLLM